MRAVRGFTLIEVLVALTIMAIMAALGWQSIDTMVRTQTLTSEQARATQRLSAGLEQWKRDLNGLQTDPSLPPRLRLAYDGLVLRMVRVADGASSMPREAHKLVVVAWTLRPNTGLSRWQSAASTDLNKLVQAWERAGVWARNGALAKNNGDGFVSVYPVGEWKIYFHVDGGWVNPQSEASMPAGQMAPDGVRLVLVNLSAHSLKGSLTYDWVGMRKFCISCNISSDSTSSNL